MRILATTLIAALLGLTSCADKDSGIALPQSPEFHSGGDDHLTGEPTVGGEDPNPTPDVPTDPMSNGGSAPVSSGPTDDPQDPPEPVPEPGTFLLFGVGLTGLAVYRRRRREAADASTGTVL